MTAVRRRADGRPGTSGFTLAEVLVVVSIIALLVAILLPSLRKAREQSKRVKCSAHQRQIAQGWSMYLDAYNGRFLQGVDTNINYGGRQGTDLAYGGNPSNPIPKPLNPMLNKPLVLRDGGEEFHCPADKGGGLAPRTHFEYFGTSYFTNRFLIGQDQTGASAFGPCRVPLMLQMDVRLPKLSLSKISNESKLILMGDAGWANTWHPSGSLKIEWHGVPRTHNIAFMDVHVEFLRIRKGMHVTSDYTVVPFSDLQDVACLCQREIP